MSACAVCGKELVEDTPDPCLGTLDGVEGADCGHGGAGAYVAFTDEDWIVGLEALHYFDSLGIGPPPRTEFVAPLSEQYDGLIKLSTVQDYATGEMLRVEWVNTHPTETPMWEINGQRVELAGSGSIEATEPLETGTL
jgi:hypothetical protein